VSLEIDAVLKPSSKNITRRLQISIVALVPAIPRPTGIALDWLTDLPSVCIISCARLQAVVHIPIHRTHRIEEVAATFG